MDARPYNLNNLRRAAEERRKAAAALTEEARRMHLDLAEIFEARAGTFPGAVDGSNVIPLRPKAVRARAARAARPPGRLETAAGTRPGDGPNGAERGLSPLRSGSASELTAPAGVAARSCILTISGLDDDAGVGCVAASRASAPSGREDGCPAVCGTTHDKGRDGRARRRRPPPAPPDGWSRPPGP